MTSGTTYLQHSSVDAEDENIGVAVDGTWIKEIQPCQISIILVQTI
jgi:hypothetical protein